jgi:hypothetical protein
MHIGCRLRTQRSHAVKRAGAFSVSAALGPFALVHALVAGTARAKKTHELQVPQRRACGRETIRFPWSATAKRALNGQSAA